MLNYLFIEPVPIQIVLDLLENICAKTDKYYIIDKNAYKKMLYYDHHISFLKNIEPYYHVSKKYYLTREMTYNSFTNIVRQICKNNGHFYKTDTQYNHSVYTIFYFVERILPAVEDVPAIEPEKTTI